jgi:hypothetical protein
MKLASMAGKLRVIGLATALFLLVSLSLSAQLNLGRIFGAVTDQSGGAIVAATVTIIDTARGISRPLTTDAAGEYSAPSLTPGTYTIRVEAKGFATLNRTDIAVGVGQDVRADLTLQPGEQAQTVTVSGEAPQVNTSNATLGGTLENQTINDLPLNGRDYLYMLNFRPGILQKPGATTNAYVSYGNRPEGAVFLFDGLYDNDIYGGGVPIIGAAGAPGTADQTTILPLDSIQEINVIQNPKAEYGWNPGGEVNIGLKSGTNSIHGTAYAFGRSDSLTAKNPFLLPSQPKASLVFEQFGASIGGPIKKDKLFYFANYEGQRYTVGVPKSIQEPTTVAGAGIANSFPDAIAAMNTAHVAVSPLSLALAGCTNSGATAGAGITCNGANSLFGNSSSSATETITPDTDSTNDNILGKVDYHLNDHHAFNGEYFFGQGTILGTASAVQPYWRTGLNTRAQVVRGVWIWTPNSSWVNEARVGYDRTHAPVFTVECTSSGGPNYAALGFVSGAPQCGFPALTVSGFVALGATVPFVRLETDWAGSDSVSYTHGRHLVKFGAEIRRIHFLGAQLTNSRGTINFGTTAAFTGATALEDFLAGVASSASVGLGDQTRHLLIPFYAGFVQDDWRLTPRLTVNLGLRYEYEPSVTEQNNLLGNFDPNTASGLIQEGNGIGSLYQADTRDFSPRLGLAWDLTGKGTTVIRAGGALIYDTPPLQNYIGTQGAQLNLMPTGFALVEPNGSTVPSPGNIQVGTVALPAGRIPWALNTAIFNSSASGLACGNGVAPNPSPCSLKAINPNLRRGYVTDWTLGVQHAFNNNLSLDVAYVGNHGTDLVGVIDANQPIPGPKNGTGAAALLEQSRRPYNAKFPYFSQIQYYTNLDESNFNGLQASLTERVNHGLSFTAAYTFSHSLDDFSNETTATAMDSLNPGLDYGAGANDARHHGTLTMTYLVPGVRSPAQLLKGWQLNTAVNLVSALPITAYDTSDDISGTSELLDRWTLAGNPKNFNAGGLNPIPCYGSSTSSTFSLKNGCTVGLPQACLNAASAEPNGPATGETGLAQLNTLGCYMQNGAVIVPPAQGTFGSMGRDVLRGKGFSEWDLSVVKNWVFKERLTTQFRAEAFNLLNQRQFAIPTVTGGANLAAPLSFGQSPSTPNLSNPVIGSGGPRAIQLGLKLIF